jgi:hypothetical protein
LCGKEKGQVKVEANTGVTVTFHKNDVEIRVRKNFFLRTLCISKGPVNTALAEKSKLTGGFIDSDKRGGKTPPNETKPETTDKIKSHIEKFPTQESHYCRKRQIESTLIPSCQSEKCTSFL